MNSVGELVTLDRSCEPWIGRFPGLGEVRVAADGTYEIWVDPVGVVMDTVSDDIAERENALRWGWAEPLSFARRGCTLANGVALVPRPDDTRCMVLRGGAYDLTVAKAHLAASGVGMIADHLIPITFSDDLMMAHPTSAPIIVSDRRARVAGFDGRPVRRNSDAVTIETKRVDHPYPVGAIVTVGHRRPGRPDFEELTGSSRMEIAAAVMLRGVFSNVGDDRRELMRHHLAIATVPSGRLHLDAIDPATGLNALLSWWDAL